MAKAKKKRLPYTSKGQRYNVHPDHKVGPRDRTFAENWLNKIEAWWAGKTDPKVTIENPNTNETNKRFIRVPISQLLGQAKDVRFGKPKDQPRSTSVLEELGV